MVFRGIGNEKSPPGLVSSAFLLFTFLLSVLCFLSTPISACKTMLTVPTGYIIQ